MEPNNLETGTRLERPRAALTPRPVRLLLVGTVRPGRERAVREVQARFPIDAASQAGIEAIEAFIGSGYYVLMLESSSTDMQETLMSCLNDERIKTFFAELEPEVDGVPGPRWFLAPGDSVRATGSTNATLDEPATAFSTAELSLAANMYRWREGQSPEIGNEPHGSGHLPE